MSWRTFLAALVSTQLGVSSLTAGTVTAWTRPDFDRWMYPFNAAPGIRNLAPTFGAVGEDGFDDLDGQFVIGFNTSANGIPTAAEIPSGQRLQIKSVTVSATHFQGGVIYDPTFDPYQSYLPTLDADYLGDTDPGRPIELYGAGLVDLYDGFAFGPSTPANIGPPLFEEGDFFNLTNPIGENQRAAFAYDPLYGNVSNAVSERVFGAQPFAVGQTTATPGSVVAQGVPGVSTGATFTFSVDLARAEVLDYIEQSLVGDGSLFFTIVSLHSAAQQVAGANPNFYTRDNFDPKAIAPTLSIDWELVPIQPQLIGDANSDCVVGAADYALWAAQFGQTADGLTADFDGNGSVGAADYALWAANFGLTCPPEGSPVPEPSSWFLAVAGLAAAGGWLSAGNRSVHARAAGRRFGDSARN